LKNHGKARAALADAAFIVGFSLSRLRRRIQRKPDNDPPQMLMDFIRHSVFCAGFKVHAVQNPAFLQASLVPSDHTGELLPKQ
jgi:N-acetylglucosaminyl-diphospho-decaprenol L-rhamnosyltransferase